MQQSSPGALRWLIWLVIAVPVFAVVAIGAYGLVAEPGCGSCHTEPSFVQATQGLAHANVECGACHAPAAMVDRALFGYRQVGHVITPLLGDQERQWAVVTDPRCIECHVSVLDTVVAARGLKVNHESCTVGFSCTDCHSATAHGEATSWVRTYDMETCLECHVSQELADCGVCHEGRLPAERLTTGVFAITHGSEWERTHGMGNSATCAACHTAADCATCHGPGLPHGPGFVSEHAAYTLEPDARCEGCHEQRYCDTCHGLEMPHPQSFIVEHAGPGRDDRPLCDRCHVESDCIVCHETHVHPGGAIGTLTGDGGAQ